MNHNKRNPVQHVNVTQHQKVWSYPVPPPDDLVKYSTEIQQTFLKEWEKESDHRRAMDREVFKMQEVDLRTKAVDVKMIRVTDLVALICSWLIVMSFGGSAIFFVYIGRDIQGLGTFIASLLTYYYLKKK